MVSNPFLLIGSGVCTREDCPLHSLVEIYLKEDTYIVTVEFNKVSLLCAWINYFLGSFVETAM